MGDRKILQISDDMRFSVLERDRCACVYCGAKPPNSTLYVECIEVGHAHEPTDPGMPDLVTNCIECSQGRYLLAVATEARQNVVDEEGEA